MSADVVMGSDDLALVAATKTWSDAAIDAEVERVIALGQRVIKLPVKNCGIVRLDGGLICNRVEVDTGFDFESVEEIMLSEPTPCPHQLLPGRELRFAVLSTGKPIVMMLPYIYTVDKANTLREWNFVNSRLQSTRHTVNF